MPLCNYFFTKGIKAGMQCSTLCRKDRKYCGKHSAPAYGDEIQEKNKEKLDLLRGRKTNNANNYNLDSQIENNLYGRFNGNDNNSNEVNDNSDEVIGRIEEEPIEEPKKVKQIPSPQPKVIPEPKQPKDNLPSDEDDLFDLFESNLNNERKAKLILDKLYKRGFVKTMYQYRNLLDQIGK
jgi:hypothetical protein